MTIQNAFPATGAALPHDPSLAGIRARIAAYCAQFRLEPPRLKIHKGIVYLDDTLLHWCDDNGASLDWIICGDVSGMTEAYRKARLDENAFKAMTAEASCAEINLLNDMMKTYLDKRDAMRAEARAAQ